MNFDQSLPHIFLETRAFAPQMSNMRVEDRVSHFLLQNDLEEETPEERPVYLSALLIIKRIIKTK
jgi:hypothetical protein